MQCKGKKKKAKGQIQIYKTLHRKLKIKQNEPHLIPGVSSGAPGGKAFPPPHTCGTCRDTLVTNLMISHACQQIG
jgi:hypothetical protein